MQAFVNFLYDSPVRTIELVYRDATGRLVAVGICDICSLSLSSVYFYFDPHQPRRSLGTYGVLHEIDFALNRKIADYYLGYAIYGCDKMKYKAGFGPYELLRPDGRWYAPGSDNWTTLDCVS